MASTGTFAVKVRRTPETPPLTHQHTRLAAASGCAGARARHRASCSVRSDAPAAQAGMAQMLKGGVIMDVVDVEQARIAEEAGASHCRSPAVASV